MMIRRVDMWLLPGLLLVIAFALRVFGYDWDHGLLLHPDELFIVSKVTSLGSMTVNGRVTWPSPFAHFFDARLAAYDPHNFNYGTLPFYLLAAVTRAASGIGSRVSWLSNWQQATQIEQTSWIGRWISALFDTGSVLVVFLIARRAFDRQVALLAMSFSTFTVLAIELSHYYAVDTILCFFVLTTIWCALHVADYGTWRAYLMMGASFGLAIATKTSAFPLLVPMCLAAGLNVWGRELCRLRLTTIRPTQLVNALTRLAASLAAAMVVFCVCDPYAIIDRRQLVSDVQTQHSIIVSHTVPVPYTIQFTGSTPYLYYLQNMFFWYLGPALGIAAGCGLLWLLWKVLRRRSRPPELLLLSWVIPYFLAIGGFWAKFGRYTLPTLPILAIFGAAFLVAGVRRLHTSWRLVGQALTGAVVVATAAWALAFMNVYASTDPQISASQWLYRHLTPSTPFATDGAWDRSLPFCPPADSCPVEQSIPLNLFDADDPAKLKRLVLALTHVKYIVMSTQRFVDSIPKVPDTYPLTNNYYRLLFNNQLNFRLVQRFTVHPALGPWEINDFPADENFTVFDHPDVRIFERTGPISATRAQTLLTTPYTGGKPTPEWDNLPPERSRLGAARMRTRHARAPTSRTISVPPIVPPTGSQDSRLMLNQRQWEEDQKAPTYDQMFPPNGLGARFPVVLWWLLVEALGLAAFPLVFFACRGLGDRGWAISRIVGMVCMGWLVLSIVGLGWASYSLDTIWLVIALVLATGAGLAVVQRRQMTAYLRRHWRHIAVTEAVFLVGFAVFIVLRMWYPDLGHQFSPVSPTNPGTGRMGEKQLELGFLNAISRSQTFPPLDPFFAGGFINYYYFGYVIVSALCKATTIPTAIGFNLAIATFFGMLLSSAYSVGRALTRSLPFALATAAFVAIIGNLNGLIQAVQDIQTATIVHVSVPVIGGLVEFAVGLFQILTVHTPIPSFDFWQSSRIVPPTGTDFAEFPYWSYLFGDLHAHVLAYPMDMAVVAIAVSAMITLRRRRLPGTFHIHGEWRFLVAVVLLAGLLLGAIEATNPLDLPAYAGVLALSIGIGWWRPSRMLKHASRTLRDHVGTSLGPIGVGVGSAAAAVAVGLGLFPPLIQGFHPIFNSGIGSVFGAAASVRLTLAGSPPFPTGSALSQAVHNAIVTPLAIYWETFGLFLFLILAWAVFVPSTRRVDAIPAPQTEDTPCPDSKRAGASTAQQRWEWLLMSRWRAIWTVRANLFIRSGLRWFRSRLVFLFWRPIEVFVLAAFFVLANLWLGAFLVLMAALQITAARRRPRDPRALWICSVAILAIVLTAFTELFYVRDFLAGGLAFRMNTVAKVYNQLWVLLALAGATAMALMWRSFKVSLRRAPRLHTRWFRSVLIVCTAFTIAASLIFTYSGTVARETYRQTWLPEDSVPLTLDGMAFMKVAYPGDYAGINWLNAHVHGTPVVIEADQAYYNWRSRVSQFTGLPTLFGGIYESSQRYPDEDAPRASVLEEIYGATTANTSGATLQRFKIAPCARLPLYQCITLTLLRTYRVSYVYSGLMERQLWPHGVSKFRKMPGLTQVFHDGGVRIFHVNGSPE
jgi:YYY domain-containing protein